MWAKIGQASSISELANLASEADYFYFATQRGVLKLEALEQAIERFGFKCYLGSRNQFRDKCIQKLIDDHATVPPVKRNPDDVPPNVRDKSLYRRKRRQVKDRVQVWPSAYASGQLVQAYERAGGRYYNPGKPLTAADVTELERNAMTGLTKWFAEEWVDLGRSIDSKGHVKKWVQCGREDSSKGKYPKCVPLAKAKKMTPKQRLDAVKRKRAAQKSAPKTKGRKPIMVKTFKKNPSSWQRQKSGVHTAAGPLRTNKPGHRLELAAEKKSGQWHLTSKIFDASDKCIYTYTSGPYKTLKDAKSRGDYLMRSKWSHSKERERGWGLVEKNPYREPASGGMKQGLFGMRQAPDASWELVGENARGKHVFGTLTQYGDSVMYSLRHFDVIPRGFSAADYRSPRLTDDKRHGVLDIHGLRGDEVFQEAFRQLATTQDLIVNDYRRVNPSDPYREKERFKHEGMEAKEAFKHEGKKAALKKRTTLRERVSKMMPKRKAKKNPSEFLPVVMHTGKGYIGDKQALYSVAGSGDKSLYDVNVFARRDGGRVVQRLQESWSTPGEDPEEAAKLAFARMVQDTGISVETRTRTEGMIPQKNPRGKGRKNPEDNDAALIKEIFDSLSKEEVKLLGGKKKVMGEILWKAGEARGLGVKEEYVFDHVTEALDYDVQELRAKAEKSPKGKKRKNPRRARKNPPIDLDYLDQMMGKEDEGAAKKEGSKRHPFLKKKEEDKRIKKFLKEGKRKDEINQDWVFTYDPHWETYEIQNDLYGRAETFDSFEEAADRLKFLDEPIFRGVQFAEATLDAPAAGESAVSADNNAYESFSEFFGRDDDRFDLASDVYRKRIEDEFNANAKEYLPPGFSAAEDDRGDYEIRDADGKVVANGWLETALDEAWEIHRGRAENPKKKRSKLRRKNPSTITIEVSYDNDSGPDEDLYEVMDTGGDFDDSWALPASDAASEVEDRKSHYEAQGRKVKVEGDSAVLRYVYVKNPKRRSKKNPKKKRSKKSPSRKLIDNCRKHWEAYCERPTKTNLKKVFKHLETMAESTAKSVKDEHRKCMRAAKAEAKAIKLKL